MKIKLYLSLLLLAGPLSIRASVQSIVLQPGQSYRLRNPSYPALDYNRIVEWNFEVNEDANIRIACDDIRMTQRGSGWSDNCPNVYMKATGGKTERKSCSSYVQDFVYKSIGRNLRIEMMTTTTGGAILDCMVMSTSDLPDTELVKLLLDGRGKLIDITKDGLLPNLRKQWNFESPKGSRISFQCDGSIQIREKCGEDVVLLNNGETDEEFCGSLRKDENGLWFSKSNRSKLRVQFSDLGGGSLQCRIQAVTGPHADQYKNLLASPEVDSSEYEVTNGIKRTSCDCGRANKRRGRIWYGDETSPNEFPWMVQIYIGWEINETEYKETTCGGTIITARHVLTAAHCVKKTRFTIVSPQDLRLVLGKHADDYPTGRELTIGADALFVGERFLQLGITHDDIALIYTNQSIDFSSRYTGPICIEPQRFDVMHKRLLILGWGNTELGDRPYHLKKGKTRVVDDTYCPVSEWEICTVHGPAGVCHGDSGGPFVMLDPETNRYTQVSLSSRVPGNKCDQFAISVRVSSYYDWIQRKIAETDSSMKTCHKI